MTKITSSEFKSIAFLPKLCVIGPLAGNKIHAIPTQGDFLIKNLREIGYQIVASSDHPNRFIRALDILKTLLLKRNSYDICLIQVFGFRSFYIEDVTSLFARFLGKKIIMVLHGGAIPKFAQDHPDWFARVLGRAHKIVTPSKYLANDLASTKFKFSIIPNAIDLNQYTFCQRVSVEPKIFWMRTFFRTYNPEMAVRVLARVKKKYPQAYMTMAGEDQGLVAIIRQMISKEGLDDSIKVLGFLNDKEKMDQARAHDIYINTNRIDNLPISVLEMCAMGLPIVSTSVGGIPYLLTDKENSLLVPPDDDFAMAQAIEALIRDPKLASRLSAEGRNLAIQYSWDKVCNQWNQLFAEIMDK